MSNRSAELLIQDILGRQKRFSDIQAGLSFEQFTLDEKTVDAVVRNFEIIGEAANRLPDEFKTQHSNIDWGQDTRIS